MRTQPILALLLLGLLLAPVLSPRPAEAAAATVTYAMTGGTYTDIAALGAPITGGSVTINLFGVTVIPSVSASWTSASITGVTWATAMRPLLSLADSILLPFGGGGTIGGFGSFFFGPIAGLQSLMDPFGLGTRPISIFSFAGAGFFTGFGGGTATAFATGHDALFSVPWTLSNTSLTEVSSSVTIVPEPGTGLLVGLGLAGLGISGGRLRRLRRRSA